MSKKFTKAPRHFETEESAQRKYDRERSAQRRKERQMRHRERQTTVIEGLATSFR